MRNTLSTVADRDVLLSKRSKPRPRRDTSVAVIEQCEPRTFLSASIKACPPPAPVRCEPKIYAPHASVKGETLSQWTEAWWQWALSFTQQNSPFKDSTGARGGLGYQGNIFYLAGDIDAIPGINNTYNATATRLITAPSGTPIFFPVMNVEWSKVEGFGSTYNEIQPWVEKWADTTILSSLFVTIDGTAVSHLASHREASGLFSFTLPSGDPAENVLGVTIPQGESLSSISVSDGWWIMTKPLCPGVHTIHFGGSMVQPAGFVGGPGWAPYIASSGFNLDITYTITVVPKGNYAKSLEAGSTAAGPARCPFAAGASVTPSVLGRSEAGVLD